MRRAFVSTMSQILEDDGRCVLILGDIGVHGFRSIAEKKPGAVINIGILEQAMIGFAAGLAMDGRIPVVHSIAPFLIERCLEQLKVDFGYQSLSGKFVSVGASFDYAALGCTHHCPGDVGTVLGIPEFEIVVPGTGAEFSTLFSATYNNSRNTYYRLSESTNRSDMPVRFGKAYMVRKGTQGTVIAVGPMLDLAMKATEGLDVTLLYYTTVRPFDSDALRQSVQTGRIFVLEPFYEGTVYADILKSVGGLDVRIGGHGIPRQFIRTYGSRDQQWHDLGFDVGQIRQEIVEFVS